MNLQLCRIYIYFKDSGACASGDYALIVMIYNWRTSEWTEYIEPISEVEMTNTKEIKCVKIIHDERTKIYAMMQPDGEQNT